MLIAHGSKHPEIAASAWVAPDATVCGDVTIGPGTRILYGARLIGVHLRTRLEPGATVPIGWVAVGDPASILPPDQHDRIWAVQEPLNFPEWVYGFNRSTPDLMIEITRSLSETLGAHSVDVVHRS
jgi:hypothetical protein